MVILREWAVLSLLLLPGFQENSPPVREEIEWLDVWVPGNSQKNLPRILFIGDSITRGYYPEVEKRLKGKAVVCRLTTSKSLGDPGLIAEVELVLSQTHFDLVHFNNGLHGWGYTEEAYRAAMPRLVQTIRKGSPGARLVWANTTPVRQSGKLDQIHPNTERVRKRNALAKDFMSKEGIAENDLFELVESQKDWYSQDGVHFSSKGNSALGEKVAKTLGDLLKAK